VSAFLPGARGAVVNASRSVVFPGSKDPTASWRDLVSAAARAAKEELDAAARRIA
jgi:hypothetical protein